MEHTVTEEITGIDLVQKQIYIAGGASLEECGLPSQRNLAQPSGYAIQCRVTSEDPTDNFKVLFERFETRKHCCLLRFSFNGVAFFMWISHDYEMMLPFSAGQWSLRGIQSSWRSWSAPRWFCVHWQCSISIL